MHCEVRNGEASCDRCSINSPLRKKRESWALRATPASELRPPRPRSPWHAHDRPSTAKARATDGTTRTRTASCAHSAARCGPLASADNGSMLAALERRIISVLVSVLVIPLPIGHGLLSCLGGVHHTKKYQWHGGHVPHVTRALYRPYTYAPALNVFRVGLFVKILIEATVSTLSVLGALRPTDANIVPNRARLRSGRASVDAHHEHDRAARG